VANRMPSPRGQPRQMMARPQANHIQSPAHSARGVTYLALYTKAALRGGENRLDRQPLRHQSRFQALRLVGTPFQPGKRPPVPSRHRRIGSRPGPRNFAGIARDRARF